MGSFTFEAGFSEPEERWGRECCLLKSRVEWIAAELCDCLDPEFASLVGPTPE